MIMNPTRTLGLALAAGLLLLTPAHAEKPIPVNPRAFGSDAEKAALTARDLELAEREMLEIPFEYLGNSARGAALQNQPQAGRWEVYRAIIRNPGSVHMKEYDDERLFTKTGGQTVYDCWDGDLGCVSAFWNKSPYFAPTLVNSGIAAASGVATFLAIAAPPSLATIVVLTVTTQATFQLGYQAREGLQETDELVAYGNDINQRLGRTDAQKWMNSYRYTFEGVLRTAWSLRNAMDGETRLLARRILFLEGAAGFTANCNSALTSLIYPADDCPGIKAGRVQAWKNWLLLLTHLNQSNQWGLDVEKTLEEGDIFRKYFPSLGNNQHVPATGGGGGGVFGVTSFG
jgi:hypothetical protein